MSLIIINSLENFFFTNCKWRTGNGWGDQMEGPRRINMILYFHDKIFFCPEHPNFNNNSSKGYFLNILLIYLITWYICDLYLLVLDTHLNYFIMDIFSRIKCFYIKFYFISFLVIISSSTRSSTISASSIIPSCI